MKQFSENDFSIIHKQLFSFNLDKVLNEQYADYIVFTIISKILMGDWDFDGAFLTKERAEAEAKELREKYNYPYTEINTRKISELKYVENYDKDKSFRTLQEHLDEIINEMNKN